MTAFPRPPRFRPPQFPPHKPRLFATTPPAIFPPILGLLGADRRAARRPRMSPACRAGRSRCWPARRWRSGSSPWSALKMKLLRRLSVLTEDLRPLPARGGPCRGDRRRHGGSGADRTLWPLGRHGPGPCRARRPCGAFGCSSSSTCSAGCRIQQRAVNPTMHLSFVGFIVGAPPLAQLGWTQTADLDLLGQPRGRRV